MLALASMQAAASYYLHGTHMAVISGVMSLQVAMSGVQMIQDNTKTCLNNLERSLHRCKAFLKHRCIPKDCAQATSVSPCPLVHHLLSCCVLPLMCIPLQ